MYKVFEDAVKEKGLTAYAVSKATGICQSTLSDWKRGRCTPKVDKMIKISKYLDIPLEKLLEGE